MLAKDVQLDKADEGLLRSPCLVNLQATSALNVVKTKKHFKHYNSESKDLGVAIFLKTSRVVARLLDKDPYVKIDHRLGGFS